MADQFIDEDPLLKSIGMTILVFHFFRLLDKTSRVSKIRREHFELFDLARQKNRIDAEADIATANYELLEFDKYVQPPNDAYATRLRLAVLVKFMRSAYTLIYRNNRVPNKQDSQVLEEQPVKVTYDPEVDVLSFEFSQETVAESDEDTPGVILDYDEAGNLVGLEILYASKRMPAPQTLECSVAVP